MADRIIPRDAAQYEKRELSTCAAPDGYRLAYVWWSGDYPMFEELTKEDGSALRFADRADASSMARTLIAAAARLEGRVAS